MHAPFITGVYGKDFVPQKNRKYVISLFTFTTLLLLGFVPLEAIHKINQHNNKNKTFSQLIYTEKSRILFDFIKNFVPQLCILQTLVSHISHPILHCHYCCSLDYTCSD